MKPLLELLEYGQSYWLDNLTRGKIESGELERRVREEGLRGVTSNPAIFHKAITRSTDYDDDIREMAAGGRSVTEIYEALVVADIRDACDVLRPVYDDSDGEDGYVSLEVSPYLAHDTAGTVEEACRLDAAVDRPNVFIKIPGTDAGVPAIEECLYRGVNINVTLLFSIESYEAVARAYIRALERRLEEGRTVDDVASVASFFLSRIDVLVDRILGHRIRPTGEGDGASPEELLGRAAVANAKLAYGRFRELFDGERWGRLEAEGARVQRMLWASTSTKDPLYSDVKYVEPLIGPDTVNTLPERTIAAFDDHGRVEETVADGMEASREVMERLSEAGVDFAHVTAQLEDEGVQKFIDPYDRLMGKLAERVADAPGADGATQSIALADDVPLEGALSSLNQRRFGERLFGRDGSLWSREPEVREAIVRRLGWLEAPDRFREKVEEIQAFADGIRPPEFTRVLVLGMGGSSECARTCTALFGPGEDRPELRVLDDTAPAAIRRMDREIDPSRTLFVVASKSGTTVETVSLYRHYRQLVAGAVDGDPGDRFVAITDPGTPLAREAEEEGFRRRFLNPEDVGGRFSALTYFGLIPMALLGVDVARILAGASRMLRRCGAPVPAGSNPAVRLGVALGLLAGHGRDKVTLLPSRELRPLAGWLRQLLAESTGKAGRGLIPVVAREVESPDAYGDDRAFVQIRSAGSEDLDVTRRLERLERAGHPVIRLELSDRYAVGGEFVRWEIAVAAAGRVLGVNPFDEPDVRWAKEITARLLEEGPGEPGAAAGDGGLSVRDPSGDGAPPEGPDVSIARFLDGTGAGDYVALLVYLAPTRERNEALRGLRRRIRERTGAATTAEFGPRYLHSTGQLHKGGPPTGRFLVLTATEGEDVPIPGEGHGFSRLHRAQAEGDLRALAERDRPVLHVDLGDDPEEGLRQLYGLLSEAAPAGALAEGA